MNVKKGLVVKASAGRDKDSYFVVLEADGKFASIADGKSRKIANPKRKNVKHLMPTAKILCVDEMTDKKLKKALSEFNSPAHTESGGE